MAISISGTTLTFNDNTTQTTAGITSAVTSAVAGNGVGVSGATGAVTFSAACPTFNSVGSYCFGGIYSSNNNFAPTSGSNYSAGSGNQQVQSASTKFGVQCGEYYVSGGKVTNNLSGTWKMMGAGFGGSYTIDGNQQGIAIFCRVS